MDACFANGRPLPCDSYNSMVYRVGSYTLATGTTSRVDFNAVETGEKPSGFFDLTNDQVTIFRAGNYTITATSRVVLGASGLIRGSIEINGTSYGTDSLYLTGSAGVNICPCVTKYLSRGDVVAFSLAQFSGIDATIDGTNRNTNFSITSICV